MVYSSVQVKLTGYRGQNGPSLAIQNKMVLLE